MNKNVKSIFFVSVLLILLLGVSAVSAVDSSDDTLTQDNNNELVTDSLSTQTVDNKIINTTAKNLKKEPKTHIVNNDTITSVFNKEETSPYNNAGFNASLLGDDIEEGDTLDFQGFIGGNYNLSINKPVNIISSTNDAIIELNTTSTNLMGSSPGNHFIITKDGSYTNITGITFHNTQIFVYNSNHVTLDNISAIVEDRTIGGGVGQTSIRENSTDITVKNSYFYTRNNGGSSTLVLAWADNCTILNNTINAEGNSGNLLYLTTMNVISGYGAVVPNSNNNIINNTIGNSNLITGGIQLACVLTGGNNTLKGNKIYGSISGQYAVDLTEIQGTVIEDNTITEGISVGPNSLIKNNNIGKNVIVKYNTTVEYNTLINTTLNGTNINFNNNNVSGIITIESSNNSITNNNILSCYDYAIIGGTNCNITDNYISTYYLAGSDAIINGTDNLIANNTPDNGVTITITDETYSDYFNEEGKISNPLITNYSTIILSGEFNNRIFDIDGYILSINAENKSTILKSSQIISEENSRIKLNSLTINNTESNIENMIILNSSLNTVYNCTLIDYSTSTEYSHRTIIINSENNTIENNKIYTSAPSVNIDYTKTPALADCISITVLSSNNSILKNIIQTTSTQNNNEYGSIEAILIQSKESGSPVEENLICNNTITVKGADYVYGVNIGQDADNNIIYNNNIKVDSTIYTAGIQVMSPASNNNISNNNINSTAATTNDRSSYGIILVNDSYNTVKTIGNNIIQKNNLRIIGFNSYGIEVYLSDNNILSENTVTITNANYATGIALSGKNNTLYNNKLSITGKSNQTSTSYDNILPTTTGINLVNAENNVLSQNKMNVTKGSAISLNNASTNNITNNNLSVKSSVGLNIYNSQNNNITLNNITTDTTNVILLNQSNTNNILDNRLTTANDYVMTIIDSANNNIHENYMAAKSNFGDNAVENSQDNNVLNNTPSFENSVYINNITYSDYFDNEGNIINNSIANDSLVIIVGNLYNKDMIFDIPVNLTVYGSTPIIYNSTIIFKKGSDGSNTTAKSDELTSQLKIQNDNTDSSSIIIENTSNINLSAQITLYGQNSNGIKINNSNNIQLYNSYISVYALNDTGLYTDNSFNLNLDLRTNPNANNDIGMKFINTENVNISNSLVWSQLSGLINTTLIEINQNTSNFHINNTIRVSASQKNCYAIKINANQEQPATNITFNGTMDIMGNVNTNGVNMTAIYADYCQNSIFDGNIIVYDTNKRFLAYEIYNSQNNTFTSNITKTSNYRSTKSYNSLAIFTNSDQNTISNITFTPPIENYASTNTNKAITLNNSNNNIISNNLITLNDNYCVYLYDSNNNTIEYNYFNSSTYGDNSVIQENSQDNIIKNNTPRQLILTDDNYYHYFDENANLIEEYDMIEINSDINNKDLIISNNIYISSSGNYTLNNATIKLLTNSDNSIIEGLNFNNTDKIAVIINNTTNIQIINNTILLVETSGEAIEVINSDNISINNNYIQTKDMIANLAIKTSDSTNTNYINNTPIATLTDEEYSTYFNDDTTFKYDVLDKIILGSDIKNKNLTFNSKIEILNPNNYTLYNTTITLNAKNSQLSNLKINNNDDRTNAIIIKSTNNTITNNTIYQENTNNPASIILIKDFTSNNTENTIITYNNITFTGNNITAIKMTNISTFPLQLTNNNITGTGTNNKILNFQNIENPITTISDNTLKLNTTAASTVITINNITGNYTGLAFYIRLNKIITTCIQNTTPLVSVSNNTLIAYISSNFIESKDLKGNAAVNGSPQYTTNNYPQNGIYRLVEVTTNIPETMIVNKTYALNFTIKDLVGDDVNKGSIYVEINGYGEYILENTQSYVTLEFTPTQTTENLEIYYRYIEPTYEYAMLETAIVKTKVVETKLTIDPITATVGQIINITARITADNQTLTDINKGKLTFKVNGKTLKDANGKVIYAKVVNGTATIENYTVPSDWTKEGTTIEAVYSGSTQCEKLTSEKINLTVAKAVPTLTTENINTSIGSTITLKATVTDGDKVINTGKIVFKINGKTVKDANGKVIYAKVVNNTVTVEYTLPEDMKARDYNITAVFISPDYDRLEDTKTLTVN